MERRRREKITRQNSLSVGRLYAAVDQLGTDFLERALDQRE